MKIFARNSGAATALVALTVAWVPDRACAQALDPETADIARSEQNRADAIVRQDVRYLKSLLGQRYYHVESNGRVRSKTEFLQAIERGDFALIEYRIEASETEVFDSFAVVRGIQVINRKTGLSSVRYKVRFLRIWQRSGCSWVNTVHQSTEVKHAEVP